MLTVFVPIILVPGFIFPYVTTRNVIFRVCVLAALFLVLLVHPRWPGLVRGRDRIFTWFAAYVIAMSVSGLFGASPWHSFFGDFERMGGVSAWLCLLLFYALLRMLPTGSWWVAFCRSALIVGDIAVIFGAQRILPESLGSLHFGMTLSLGGAIGNPGLLGPYLLLLVAFAAYLLLTEARVAWRLFAAISAAVLLAGMAFSLNRSSQLGFTAGVIVAAGIYFRLSTGKRALAKIYLVVALLLPPLAILGRLMVHREAPGASVELLSKWRAFAAAPIDESRIIEWKIALEGFRDRPILGYGPENHQVIRSVHFDPRVYGIEGAIPFDRTHNAWLELLATGGVLGAFAMIGIWIAAIATLRKGVRDGKLAPSEVALFGGALSAYAVYLTFWFFDINSVMLWVALLALIGTRVEGQAADFSDAAAAPRGTWLLAGAVQAAILAAIYFGCVAPLRAASDFNAAVQPGGTVEDHLDAFYRVMDSPSQQTFHTLESYGGFLSALAPTMGQTRANPVLYGELTRAFRRGLEEANRSVARDPANDRVYVEKARVQALAGEYFGDRAYYAAAIASVRRALAMSPNRSENRVALAEIYLIMGDSTTAMAELDTASRIAPGYTVPYARLASVAIARKNYPYTAVVLARAIDNGYVDRRVNYPALVRALERRGDTVPAIIMQQAERQSRLQARGDSAGRFGKHL